MNAYWEVKLFVAVQSVVHLPANATSPAGPGIHGTVKFLFDNGAIKDPAIVASTGNADLDKLLLQQVVTAQVPKPFGLHTDRPHEFELLIEMFMHYESFEYNVYVAIGSKKEYPRDPLLQDIMGITTVDFDYLDAKASHIVMVNSSGNKQLDTASLSAVSKAELSAPPPGYTGKTLHMKVIFCYDITYTEKCPTGNNVIDAGGTRILRRTTSVRY